jgi:hypothetical protein
MVIEATLPPIMISQSVLNIFIIYLYAQIALLYLKVALLRDRDEQSHQALAGEMLYRSVIGPEFPNHPELQAFKKGFNLACRNGFNFSQVISV